MLANKKVEFFAVPILGVEVTLVFHGLSCLSKEMIVRANVTILQRDKYATMCGNLVLIYLR
jgi:hypothetical protein